MNLEYITIKNTAHSSFTEKKSEFIGDMSHVETEEEAIKFISDIKNRYKNARHYVYCYILRNNNILRYSDDGEPQGKAAIPALEVIKTNNLTDIVFVSTRYFGGVLLGGGGLARAYSNSASLTVSDAEKCLMVMCYSISLSIDYSLYETLNFYFKEFSLSVKHIEYSDKVDIFIDIVKDEYDRFCSVMTEKSAGKAIIKILNENFSDLPVKET